MIRWIDRRQILIGDAQPVLHVGTEVLDHHVGALDHAQEQRAPSPAPSGSASAPACCGAGSACHSRAARLIHAGGGLALRRRLDLDHIRAEIGQARGNRSAPHARASDQAPCRDRRAVERSVIMPLLHDCGPHRRVGCGKPVANAAGRQENRCRHAPPADQAPLRNDARYAARR